MEGGIGWVGGVVFSVSRAFLCSHVQVEIGFGFTVVGGSGWLVGGDGRVGIIR